MNKETKTEYKKLFLDENKQATQKGGKDEY